MEIVGLSAGGFPGGIVVKNLSDNAGDTRDVGLIPGLGKPPGVGNGNPFHFLSGKFHRQRNLVGHSPWGLQKET